MNRENERKDKNNGQKEGKRERDRVKSLKRWLIFITESYTFDENNNKTPTNDKKNRWNFTTAQISMYDQIIVRFNLLFAAFELANERKN